MSQPSNDLVMVHKLEMCALQVCERLVGQATDQKKAASSHLYPVLCAHEGPIPQVRLFAACIVISDLLVPEHSAYKQASSKDGQMLLRCLSTLHAFAIAVKNPIAWMKARLYSSHFGALQARYVSYKVSQL